ncbi:MAG: EAL domain-containing protein [Gemmatimonadales bacterium]|nr:EAL domain-containing protein [Gemmatimonadales bacterium]
MTPITVVSLPAALAAAGWSVVLLARRGDWRHRLLAAGLLLLALGQVASLALRTEAWLGGLPALGLSVVALLTVALLDRTILRHRSVERDFGVERAHLEELFERSPEAIALVDNEGGVLRANSRFTALFGYGAPEIFERSIDELLAPSRRFGEALAVTRQMLVGEKVSFESVFRRKDGTPVDVSVLCTPVMMAGRQIAAFLMYRDITMSRRVDAAFRPLEKAVENMQLGVTVTDLVGRIVYMNPADAAMHGYSVEDLVGRDVRVFAAPGTERRMTPEQIEQMKTWRRETVNVRRDGTLFPVHLMSDVVRNAVAEPIGVVTTCEDITQRKMGERALWESQERYSLAVRGGNDGLWDWNLVTNEVYYSARWKSMLGYSEAEVGGGPEAWLSRVHPDDLGRVKADLGAHREDRSLHFENEHRLKHKDGTYRWVLARGIAERDPQGKPYRIAGSLTDITQHKAVEEQLVREALHDTLTGLPNRAFLTDLLERGLRRRKRQKEYAFAALFVDLDRFKVVNDSLGHAAGDQLLMEVGRRLEECVRPGDVVARLGGDEFCVMLDDVKDSSDSTRVAERIQAALKAPVRIDGRDVFATASIGIAVTDGGIATPEQLLRNADTAMYRAKARGKARFEVFDRGMHERAVAALQLETDLRYALDHEQFRLVYLPVVALETQRITSFEALVRWEHPERGLVPPAEFLPLAEEMGLIVPLGRWVLRQACRQMSAWVERFQDMPDLSVSVNLSAKQLHQTDLVHHIAEVLHETRLEPGRLKLEIAEAVLMDDPDLHVAVVRQLSDLGVQVQVDDFGTGSSSLNYLSRFQIDTLKIDRSFVSSLGDHVERSAVVQAIITVARELGIRVVAEGIETTQQSDRLITLRCERGQGYLYSQPVDAEKAAALLQEQREG